jgi:hypothetical protein
MVQNLETLTNKLWSMYVLKTGLWWCIYWSFDIRLPMFGEDVFAILDICRGSKVLTYVCLHPRLRVGLNYCISWKFRPRKVIATLRWRSCSSRKSASHHWLHVFPRRLDVALWTNDQSNLLNWVDVNIFGTTLIRSWPVAFPLLTQMAFRVDPENYFCHLPTYLHIEKDLD